MFEMHVTATDFRAHLTDLANAVAERGERVVMARHRLGMVALVSKEDLDFLRKHRPLPSSQPEEPEPRAQDLPEPDAVSTEELERLYAATKGRHEDAVIRWRGRAFVTLKCRTGKYPADDWLNLDTS
jgi:hypothetical protein